MKRLLCIWMSISLFWPLNRIWGQNIRADIEHMTDCDLYSTQYRGNYQNYYRYEIDSTFVKGILISIQKNKESPFCAVFIKSHGTVPPGGLVDWNNICPETTRNDIEAFRILDGFLRSRYGGYLQYSSNLQPSVEKYPSSYELWDAISHKGHELSSILSDSASQEPRIILTLNNEALSATYISDHDSYDSYLQYLHKEKPLHYEKRKGIARLFFDFPYSYSSDTTTKFSATEAYLQECRRIKSTLPDLHKEINSMQQELSILYRERTKAIEQTSDLTKKALAEETARQRRSFESDHAKVLEKYKKLCESFKKKPYDMTKKYKKRDYEKQLIHSFKSYMGYILKL